LGLHPRTLFPFREEVRGQERIELGWSGQTNQVKFYNSLAHGKLGRQLFGHVQKGLDRFSLHSLIT